jgi:hypothetical protein
MLRRLTAWLLCLVLALPVQQQGGTPVLASGSPLAASFVVVLHGGGLLTLDDLRQWAQLNGQPPSDPARLVVPQVEPGAYAVCTVTLEDLQPLLAGLPPQGPCAGGNLGAGGELVLKVPGS